MTEALSTPSRDRHIRPVVRRPHLDDRERDIRPFYDRSSAVGTLMLLVGLAVLCTLLTVPVIRTRHRFWSADRFRPAWRNNRKEIEFFFVRPTFSLRRYRRFVTFISRHFHPWTFRDYAAHIARHQAEVVSDDGIVS